MLALLLSCSYALMMSTRQNIHKGLPSLCQCLLCVLNTTRDASMRRDIKNHIHNCTHAVIYIHVFANSQTQAHIPHYDKQLSYRYFTDI